MLKNLAKKHDISLFSFIRDEDERKFVNKLIPYCTKIVLLKRSQSPWALRNALISFLTPYPFLVSIYLSKTAQRKLAGELAKNKYDIIHAETFYVMPNIPETKIPTLLVEQTIEYLGYQTFTDQLKLKFLKPLFYMDVAKIKKWERIYWGKADRLVTMSQEDRDWIKSMVPKADVSVVANGIDVDFFKVTPINRPVHPTVLFVGNYKWLPNVDAAKHLVGDIWPLILKEIPDAKLNIVGRDPTPAIKSLGEKAGVRVVGEVEDIRQALGEAQVMVTPIRNGRGTRYKILEAMASGLPVVSTTLGIEGIQAENGRHALIRDGVEELAQATIKLLKNKNLAYILAENAKKLVMDNFNWEKISADLDGVYRSMEKKR